MIGELDTRLAGLEAEIVQVLADGAWAESATLLASITGIGMITSAWLLVGTLNFQGWASAEAAAAYVGLVPLTHESGRSVRGRSAIGRGGHGRVRTALYLATLTAARLEQVAKALSSESSPAPLAPAQPARETLAQPQVASPHASRQLEQRVVLLSTKLAQPRLPTALVVRERLLSDLDAALSHRLTLLSASAGWGKTTLLATWLAERQKAKGKRQKDGDDTLLPFHFYLSKWPGCRWMHWTTT